ncbi:hypothetical protein [Serratia marcescens]|uniref:Uncharacterized protein n=1 Tax=Serratia marcescens TaxID=615 RepID=A0A379Y311_SERMA|nr:hypothetical protein [Serratia marcescens]KFD16602.1 signal transduction response regulator [Serratia marcescens subsp. marcescens ATCC 13880]KFL03170.1 hypothetical protein DP21_4527 [Serratia marcescens]MCC3252208.1 hypothetical protein [Serratia marcescens]PNU42272.1 hypothetical protein C2M02_24210 [Serratia marcescens subsp. marcescens ATCC 13880]QDL84480.1 hypothetical protein FG183_03075 [Serratia marcescens subsp. marcescens ATCC 13880]
MAVSTGSECFSGQIATASRGRVSAPLSIAVVDACQFGLIGLHGLLTLPALSPTAIAVSAHEQVESALVAVHLGQAGMGYGGGERCLVLRLSAHPAQALQQLLYLEHELMVRAGFRRLVVLSPFGVNNAVRQVLVCGGVRLPVRIVDARSPVMWLRRVVLSQAGEDELLPQMPALILSAPERWVLVRTLMEISIHQQARLQHRNNKTLYAQRHNALRKLHASGVADLLRRFVSM